MARLNIRRILWLLRERWYLALLIVLVLLGAFFTAFAFYPAQYSSRAVLVVTTPNNGGRISADPRTGNDITNPLFNFDSGQNIAAAILIASANSPLAQQRLGANAGGSAYTVSNGNTNPEVSSSGPFIYVDATAPTARGAGDTSAAVVQYIRSDLLSRQVALGAPPSTFLSLTDVVSPTPPEEQMGNRLVAAVAAVVFCLLAALAILDRLDRAHGRVDPPRPPEAPRRDVGLDADTETFHRTATPPINGGSTPSPRPRVGPS